ncbi:MAG: hypothetical protein FWH27_11035 [Planctomycetaceae bacterium]|nr:hypothetical protein [Planctomycetaceae bacterium]
MRRTWQGGFAVTADWHEFEAHMKKSTVLFALWLILLSGCFSQVFATQPYRPGCWRDIDTNYRFNAKGNGHISLCRKEPDQVIFEVQGSGNSEYCVWHKYVLFRVVPLKNDGDEIEDFGDNENEAMRHPPPIDFSPETISLPGQPYEYYIFIRETAEIIGPLTEDEFIHRDEVGKYQVKWKYIERTNREYSNGMTCLVIYFLFMLFCMYVLPWLILLVIIIYLVRQCIKERCAMRQAACVEKNRDGDVEETA